MKNSILEVSRTHGIFIVNHDSLGMLVTPEEWEEGCFHLSDVMYRNGVKVTEEVHPGSASRSELEKLGLDDFRKTRYHWK
jgi:hypothetical protein